MTWTKEIAGKLRRPSSRLIASFESKRCDRWQQVQSREQPRQEFHEREDRAAAQAIGRERSAVSEPARHCRSTGSVGDADVEEGADQGETGKTEIGDGQAGGDREAGAGFTGSANIADRSRQPLDGDERAWVRSRWVQRADRR